MPKLGYNEAAAIAEEAHRTGRTVKEIVLAKNLVSATELDSLLDLTGMTRPAIREGAGGGSEIPGTHLSEENDRIQSEDRWRDDGGQG